MIRLSRGTRLAVLALASLTVSSLAQDGGQLYATYCSACHAPDGKGATGGQFPPLAGSPWIQGRPDRAIKVVLHGLDGPIDIAGKHYNLVMPPQGAVLPDDQIAAILTFVRSSWGNQGRKVTPKQVATIRAATKARTNPWTQKEILKLHPLPKRRSALRNLTSRIYHGKWKKLPDFSKLEANNIEEEHDGIISVRQSDRKDHFGMVWEADFIAPEKGDYVFRFACDDGGRIILDGEVMLEVHGIGPMGGGRTQAAKLELDAGAHPIRVEYYEYTGHEGIAISWKGPGVPGWQDLTDIPHRKTGPPKPAIPIEPTAERAAIFRGFIDGTTQRAIGIGFPGGVNFAYSADHLAPELLWTGKFMDGGRHWTNRGQGAEPPSGTGIVKASGNPAFPEGSEFRGYRLDPKGNPTFLVDAGGITIADHYTSEDDRLVRTLKADGKGEPIEILITDLLSFSPGQNGEYQLGPQLSLTADDAHIKVDEGKACLKLAPGQSSTLTYSYK